MSTRSTDFPAHFYAPAAPPAITPQARIEAVERFFDNTGVRIKQGGSQASYNMADDLIRMPPFETFESAAAYYATLAHESAPLDPASVAARPGFRAQAFWR